MQSNYCMSVYCAYVAINEAIFSTSAFEYNMHIHLLLLLIIFDSYFFRFNLRIKWSLAPFPNRPFHFLFPVFKIKGKCPVNDFLSISLVICCVGKHLGDYRWFNF